MWEDLLGETSPSFRVSLDTEGEDMGGKIQKFWLLNQPMNFDKQLKFPAFDNQLTIPDININTREFKIVSNSHEKAKLHSLS